MTFSVFSIAQDGPDALSGEVHSLVGLSIGLAPRLHCRHMHSPARLQDLCLLRQAPGSQEHAAHLITGSAPAQPSARAQPTSSSASTITASVATRGRTSTSTAPSPAAKMPSASTSSRGASAAKMSSSTSTGNTAPTRTTRSTAAATAANPNKPKSSTVPAEFASAQTGQMQGQLPASHAAVVLCGPDGMGKARLARALAAEAGARLIEFPNDLLDSGAYPTTAKAAATIRAIFKVGANALGAASQAAVCMGIGRKHGTHLLSAH